MCSRQKINKKKQIIAFVMGDCVQMINSASARLDSANKPSIHAYVSPLLLLVKTAA